MHIKEGRQANKSPNTSAHTIHTYVCRYVSMYVSDTEQQLYKITVKEAPYVYVCTAFFMRVCAQDCWKNNRKILERKSESEFYEMLPAEGQMSKEVKIHRT